MKRLSLLLLVVFTCRAQTPTEQIMGPVIPYGDSPLAYYDITIKGLIDEVVPLQLAYTPQLGSALSGTFALDSSACGITLTGAGASAVSVSDWLIVAHATADGAGTGRLLFIVSGKVGNVLTDNTQCGQAAIPSESGLTVYTCSTQCNIDILTPSGNAVMYACGYWGLCGQGEGNTYYDPALAIENMNRRTGTASYKTMSRSHEDLHWIWNLNHGTRYGRAPRQISIVSTFVRALDGQTQRLPEIQEFLSFYGYHVDGIDNREIGYVLNAYAVGAFAEQGQDETRQAQYCTWMESLVDELLATQHVDGVWPEKPAPYPYLANVGFSPWRLFSIMQGLSRAHDALNDATICNDSSKATTVLAAIELGAQAQWDYGYDQTLRAMHYDTQHEADGRKGNDELGWQTGTVTASLGSAAVVGSGTSFLSVFNCNGTDFIGAEDPTFGDRTHRVASCADNTHLTLSTNWGTQCSIPYTLTPSCAVAGYSGMRFHRSPRTSTTCGNMASWCTHGGVTADSEYRVFNAETMAFPFGWLYHTTGNAQWKTYGDEIFSSLYGGPQQGPGYHWPTQDGTCEGVLGCDDIEVEQLSQSLHSCTSNPTLPCANAGYAAEIDNPYKFGSRTLGQAAGISLTDAYLAWRLGEFAPDITQTCPLTSGTEGVSYSATLTTAGSAPLTWTISAGSLPTGLSLSTGGALTGTPTTAGSYSFTLSVENSVDTDTKSCSMTIDSDGEPEPSSGGVRSFGKVILRGRARI